MVCLGIPEPSVGNHGNAFLGGMHTAGKGMAPVYKGDMLEPQRDYHLQHFHERFVKQDALLKKT
jgi:hypothetical protein